jgi:predicted Zn-dependent protease
MSSLDFDLDGQINNLELEWRLAYDASIVARAEYQTLAAKPSASVESVDMARERLERTEAKKARIMAKIERLEDSMLGKG